MDLSMANILLCRGECLKMCGLGCSSPVACVLSFKSEPVSTESVRAPEVWLGGSHDGSACDLWGLGVIAAALLTGAASSTWAARSARGSWDLCVRNCGA